MIAAMLRFLRSLFGLLLIVALLLHGCRSPGVEKETARSSVVQLVGVTDGDTITVRISGKQVKVRLAGIDAPERKQAFGSASKEQLSELTPGRRITLQSRRTFLGA